jgi:hypothetical protein
VLITKPKAREVEAELIDLGQTEYALSLNAKIFLHNADLNMLAVCSESSEAISELSDTDDANETHR